MAEESDFQRIPAQEVKVSELSQECKRVALVGEIVSLQPESLKGVFSDASGKADLVFASKEQLSKCGKGLLRVIGRPFFNDDGTGINVEFVHSLEGFNVSQWEKVKALEKKFGVRE